MTDACASCGMHCHAGEYHPFLACEHFKRTHDSRSVRANLRAVVEYGMNAQRAGVTLDGAMSSIASVIRDNPKRPSRSVRKLAEQIAHSLFRNGFGERARRLVLELEDGRDGGGLCVGAVVDRIAEQLPAPVKKARKRVRARA